MYSTIPAKSSYDTDRKVRFTDENVKLPTPKEHKIKFTEVPIRELSKKADHKKVGRKGVSRANNKSEDEFTLPRLSDILKDNKKGNAKAIPNQLAPEMSPNVDVYIPLPPPAEDERRSIRKQNPNNLLQTILRRMTAVR